MTFTDFSCNEFTEKLASAQPVPGGGGAAALVGAIGMALGNMVGSLTVGKKKYAAVEQDIIAAMKKAAALREKLLSLVEEDAKAFEPLSKAYGLPKDTPEQQEEKARVMEAALRFASEPPLMIMECCCEAIDLLTEFAAKGSVLALSDAGCGAACCLAALKSASLNVFINTKAMADRDYAAQINEKAQGLLRKYTTMAEEIFTQVQGRFIDG